MSGINADADESSEAIAKKVPKVFGGNCGQMEARKEQLLMARTWGQMFKIWPYHSFLIVIMEFSLEFSALNNVFLLYFINVLQFSPDTAVIIVSTSLIIEGFLRLFGSVISDSYLGKFRAIFIGACIYIVGKLVLTTASFMTPGLPHPYLDFGAQLIILVGTSTMRPSIAPFGADQFEPHQEKMISLFYSIFYASINIGKLIANTMMPILRAHPCFGRDSCYPLSFSVSTIGVIASFVIFVSGTRFYLRRPSNGEKNMFVAVYKIVQIARANRTKAIVKGSPKAHHHWLDHYFDTHSCEQDLKCMELRKKMEDPFLCQKAQFIEDFRCLLRLLVVFIPIPMFFALHDQQYNVWTNQALQMDSRLWGQFRLLPDQMQMVNPVLLIVLIFLFQSTVYPSLERIVLLTSLRKMVAGGVIAALAFIVSGCVQLMINPTLPDIPGEGHAFISFVNTLDNNTNKGCTLEITHLGIDNNNDEIRRLEPNSSLVSNKSFGPEELFNVKWGQTRWNIKKEEGIDCPAQLLINGTFELSVDIEKGMEMGLLVVVDDLTAEYFGAFLAPAETQKPTGGAGQFKVGVVLALEEGGENGGVGYDGRLALCRHGQECDHHAGSDFHAFHDTNDQYNIKKVPFALGNGEAMLYPYIEVRPGRWTLYYLHNAPSLSMAKEQLEVEPVGEGIEFQMEDQGGVYALIVTGTKEQPRLLVHQIVPPNRVNILWQLPQILIISVAEVLVAITGMEFAYSQSGASMKTIAASCWSLTMAFGNIIIIIITLLPIVNLATKAFLNAGLMLFNACLLAVLASFWYEYRKGTTTSTAIVSNSRPSSNSEEEISLSHPTPRL